MCVSNNDNQIDLRMRMAVPYNKDIIFGTIFHGRYVVKLNIRNGEMELISAADSSKLTGVLGVFNKKDIYIPSFLGEEIVRYNIEDKKMDCLNLNMKKKSNYISAISYATVFDEKIYIFASLSNEIYVYDLKKDSIRIIPILKDYIFDENSDVLFSSGGSRENDKIQLFSPMCKGVISYDLRKEESVLYRNNVAFEFRCGVARSSEYYFLSDESGIFKGEIDGKKIVNTLLLSKDKYCFGDRLGKIAVTEKSLWLLPGFNSDIKIYNFEDGSINNYSNLPEDHKYLLYGQEYLKFDLFFETEDKYCFWNFVQSHLLLINKRNGKESWIKPYISDYEKSMKVIFDSGRIISENEMKLSSFIENVKRL